MRVRPKETVMMELFKLALFSVFVVSAFATDIVVAFVTVSNAQGCASGPYVLPETFKVGTTTVTSIFLCHNGYITVAGQSVNLENPDDLLDPPTTIIAGGLIDVNDNTPAVLVHFNATDISESAAPCMSFGLGIGAVWNLDSENQREVVIACGTDEMGGKRCLIDFEIYNYTQITQNGQYMRFGINGPDSNYFDHILEFFLLFCELNFSSLE